MPGRFATRIVALLVTVLVAVVGPAVPGLADEQNFKVTVVDRISSLEVVGDQVIIEAEGRGQSKLLGPISTTSSVVQDLGPGCQPAVVEFTIFAEGGTIVTQIETLVCPHFKLSDGTWEVTGGTGEFAGVTGAGTLTGSTSHPPGQDPTVIHLEGSLSF